MITRGCGLQSVVNIIKKEQVLLVICILNTIFYLTLAAYREQKNTNNPIIDIKGQEETRPDHKIEQEVLAKGEN